MKTLLYYVLGYVLLEVPECEVRRILNIANKNKVKIISIHTDNGIAKVKLYAKDERLILIELSQCGVEFYVSARRGVCFVFRKYRHRLGMFLGVVLFFFVLYVSPMFIWEINIEGTSRLSHEYVTSLLKNEGVYIGAFSPLIDRKSVYMNILKSTEDISWLTVNFSGSSVNVEIVERDYHSDTYNSAMGANIVAARDGNIVDYSVVSGELKVRKGEVVKKGDMLVSGVYDTKKMGTRYVYAKGDIFAVVNDEYYAEIELENKKRVYGEEKVLEMSLKMFSKSINIFKNYSILDTEYDTIIRKEKIPIPLLSKLPVTIEYVCALPYKYEDVLLSETEALSRAKNEVYRKIESQSDYFEVLGFEESYFIDSGLLYYKCNVEAVENIAATVEFDMR